ncbi:hypothetical protein [Clostridium gasigenes]|uniref:Uncharacterized protein n=1 Tax=Clostridium gasigenes TaxID=94869 RepID=A0A1H0M5R7_9CLOT|nr:hypothetical protein [Clostridium gasigenes]SDO75641.1 hypothetical protein SAMN04488529_101328 [Clostridium gasigenes]
MGTKICLSAGGINLRDVTLSHKRYKSINVITVIMYDHCITIIDLDKKRLKFDKIHSIEKENWYEIVGKDE